MFKKGYMTKNRKNAYRQYMLRVCEEASRIGLENYYNDSTVFCDKNVCVSNSNKYMMKNKPIKILCAKQNMLDLFTKYNIKILNKGSYKYVNNILTRID